MPEVGDVWGFKGYIPCVTNVYIVRILDQYDMMAKKNTKRYQTLLMTMYIDVKKEFKTQIEIRHINEESFKNMIYLGKSKFKTSDLFEYEYDEVQDD